MSEPRTYPEGVTSWVDVATSDLGQAQAFYGELMGWAFERVSPDGAPPYVIARLDGQDVAGLAESGDDGPAWNTYVAVDDADQVAARVLEHGGHVLVDPSEAGDAGRWAVCADPAGVRFRLWQAASRPGAQLVNAPGTWNFSDLHAADPGASTPFYTQVFGWEVADLGFATMIRRPGYGDHLAATVDPGIHERQAGAQVPPGFADAIGWVAQAAQDETPHWHVSFSVADRDASVDSVHRLGGTVVSTNDTMWTREALVRDPDGAVFTASQFAPPG
jgi:predicted enzyme related to lactoylglutathione lyase